MAPPLNPRPLLRLFRNLHRIGTSPVICGDICKKAKRKGASGRAGPFMEHRRALAGEMTGGFAQGMRVAPVWWIRLGAG